eukprot:COSAG02_NODE_35540_length_466_cov_5.122616_1_plen_86_part_01
MKREKKSGMMLRQVGISRILLLANSPWPFCVRYRVRACARAPHAYMHARAGHVERASDRVADSDRARRQLASQVVGLRLSRERLAA